MEAVPHSESEHHENKCVASSMTIDENEKHEDQNYE